MIKDFFNNIQDYATSRITNPFLGTLLVVWIFRNFDLLYATFHFDPKVTLTQRIDYFHRYSQKLDFWHFSSTVLIAFILMLLTFMLMLFARFITNFYTISLNYLNDKTDKGSVVSRVDYNKLRIQLVAIKAERESFKADAEGLLDANKLLKNNNEYLETQINDLNVKLEKSSQTITNLNGKTFELDKQVKEIKESSASNENDYITEIKRIQLAFATERMRKFKITIPTTKLIKIFENQELYRKSIYEREPETHELNFITYIYDRFLTIDYYLLYLNVERNNSTVELDYNTILPFVKAGLIHAENENISDTGTFHPRDILITQYGYEVYDILRK